MDRSTDEQTADFIFQDTLVELGLNRIYWYNSMDRGLCTRATYGKIVNPTLVHEILIRYRDGK
jgi:hypothetical protein